MKTVDAAGNIGMTQTKLTVPLDPRGPVPLNRQRLRTFPVRSLFFFC